MGDRRDVSLLISFQQVAHLLEEQHAIITGGRSKEGCPIVTFPDNGKFAQLSDDDFALLITYLSSVPSLQDADMGFVLIIDRRHDKWSSVKTALGKISAKFPAMVRSAYVLRPSGLLQKAISEVSQKFSSSSLHTNDDFAPHGVLGGSNPFKIFWCNSVEDLGQHFDLSQLTPEFRGALPYSHTEWMQHRLALEKFDESAKLISRRLQEFSSRTKAKEISMEMSGLKECLENETAEQSKLNQDLESVVRSGETLLNLFREPYARDPASLSRLYPNRVLNVASVQSLLLQLEETQRRFKSDFWAERKAELSEKLDCLKFELQAREVGSMLRANLVEISSLAAKINQADSFNLLDELSAEVGHFRDAIQDSLCEAEDLEKRGWETAQTAATAPVDRKSEFLVPVCKELGDMVTTLKSRVAECDAALVNQRQLLAEIQEANEWCSQGVDLLAAQQVEKYASVDFAQKALIDLERFLEAKGQLRLLGDDKASWSDSANGSSVSQDSVDGQPRMSTSSPRKPNVVQMVKTRMDDILTMCEKRKICLKRLSTKPSRPVQAVHPTTASSNVKQPSAVEKLKERPGSDEVKEAKIQEDEEQDSEEPAKSEKIRCISVPMLLDSSNAVVNDIVNRNSGSKKLANGLGASTTSLSTIETSKPTTPRWGPEPPSNAVSSAATQQQYLNEERRRKRTLVVKELVDTERVYVAELDAILRGYREPLVRGELRDLTPPPLVGKADVLFGNLGEISAFHRGVFLLDLEASFEEPCLIAKCFMQRKEMLYQLYTKYCRNKPSSEELRRRVSDTNPFFLECQQTLGHRLPLSAYLLKPVQRVTKYQLLLKDLLRYSDPQEFGTRDIAEALDAMLGVLKSVNDSMHQVAILGFPTTLSSTVVFSVPCKMTLLEQQGRLLLNGGPFHVWITHREHRFDPSSQRSSKSRLGINLLATQRKPKSRHLFLYEKAVLFCKQVSWPAVTTFVNYCGPPDTTFESPYAYEFKHYLNMTEVGLTEKVGTSSRKFELWLSNRHEVYVLQAPSADAKTEWVREIKRVLFEQLQCLRGKNTRQYSGLVALRRQNSAPVKANAWDTSSICSSDATSASASVSSCSRNSSFASSSASAAGKRLSSITTTSDLNRMSYVTTEEEEEEDEEKYGRDGYETEDVESSCVEEESDWETDTMASGLMGFEAPRVYVCLAEYNPVEPSEVELVEGEVVEVVQTGGMGWCYVKSILGSDKQGWAPIAYLAPDGPDDDVFISSSRKSSKNYGRRLPPSSSSNNIASNATKNTKGGSLRSKNGPAARNGSFSNLSIASSMDETNARS